MYVPIESGNFERSGRVFQIRWEIWSWGKIFLYGSVFFDYHSAFLQPLPHSNIHFVDPSIIDHSHTLHPRLRPHTMNVIHALLLCRSSYSPSLNAAGGPELRVDLMQHQYIIQLNKSRSRMFHCDELRVLKAEFNGENWEPICLIILPMTVR